MIRTPLTFERLRTINRVRCENVFHPIAEWSETDWMCAAAGEMGEAANKIKKRRRGEEVSIDDVIDELADAVIYADLLATRMGACLEDGIRRKFNEVSARRGSDLRL